MKSTAAFLAAFSVLFAAGGPARAEPFMDDAKAGAQIRSLYFNRDQPASIQESWAAGGWLWGRTGYWRDFLAFGGTLYGSLPLYGPDDRDGTPSAESIAHPVLFTLLLASWKVFPNLPQQFVAVMLCDVSYVRRKVLRRVLVRLFSHGLVSCMELCS